MSPEEDDEEEQSNPSLSNIMMYRRVVLTFRKNTEIFSQ